MYCPATPEMRTLREGVFNLLGIFAMMPIFHSIGATWGEVAGEVARGSISVRSDILGKSGLCFFEWVYSSVDFQKG